MNLSRSVVCAGVVLSLSASAFSTRPVQTAGLDQVPTQATSASGTVDPTTARAAGFSRPILHGMCTYGFAARAVLQAACAYDPRRMRTFGARISAPVYPGDVLRTEIWQDGEVVSFRTTVPARDNVVVINNGRADVVTGS